MAFAIRNLSVLAYANGFTLWHYKASADDQHRVAATNFFNEAGDMLAGGDIIMVSAPDRAQLLTILTDQGTLRTASMG